jgi:hypothetical protein
MRMTTQKKSSKKSPYYLHLKFVLSKFVTHSMNCGAACLVRMFFGKRVVVQVGAFLVYRKNFATVNQLLCFAGSRIEQKLISEKQLKG